jgi:hypothetical protein
VRFVVLQIHQILSGYIRGTVVAHPHHGGADLGVVVVARCRIRLVDRNYQWCR